MGWLDTTYYEYTYDKYYFPNIINIIDEILNDQEDQINFLFTTDDLSYDVNNYCDSPSLNEIKNILDEYIKTYDKKKLESAKMKLDIFKHRDIQKQNKSIKDYYFDLQNCFEFQKITDYNKDEINKLQNIFGDEWQKKVKKILKLNDCVNSSTNDSYVKQIML